MEGSHPRHNSWSSSTLRRNVGHPTVQLSPGVGSKASSQKAELEHSFPSNSPASWVAVGTPARVDAGMCVAEKRLRDEAQNQ